MVDQLPEAKVHVSFVECLEILWKTKEKAPESAKTNIPTSFQNFLAKIGKCLKVLKTTFQHFLIIFLKISQGRPKKPSLNRVFKFFLKIFGNFQKTNGKNWKILICNLHWYFALVLLINCTALSQSESSNFFMYVISRGNYTNN